MEPFKMPTFCWHFNPRLCQNSLCKRMGTVGKPAWWFFWWSRFDRISIRLSTEAQFVRQEWIAFYSNAESYKHWYSIFLRQLCNMLITYVCFVFKSVLKCVSIAKQWDKIELWSYNNGNICLSGESIENYFARVIKQNMWCRQKWRHNM